MLSDEKGLPLEPQTLNRSGKPAGTPRNRSPSRRLEGRPAEEALIQFGDGSTIDSRSAGSTYRAGHKEGQRLLEAWVGGTGFSMVVLFEYGKGQQGPYPVTVIALEGRTVPSSEEGLPA